MTNAAWDTKKRLRLIAIVALVWIVVWTNLAWSKPYRVQIEPLTLGLEAAPGVPGVNYSSSWRWLRSSRDGRFTWQAELTNGQEGIWVNDREGTRLLALGGLGATYLGIYDQPSGFINSNGDVTVVVTQDTASLTGPQDIIVTNGVTERIVLRSGQQAPGLSPGITIEAGSVGVLITDTGVLTFRRSLAGPGVTRANENSWWVGPPDDLQLFIREGAPAPGLPGEFIGGLVGSPIRINDSGYGSITERLANNSRDVAIWAGTPGDLELVAFGGFPAPETDGLTFRITGSAAVMETNELVFGIGFDDPTTGLPAGVGLYRGARDNLNLIIGPDSLSIFEDEELIKLSSPFVNRTGEAVMTAVLSNGLGIERRAIIKVDLDAPSQTTLVVAEGDPAPGSTSKFTQIIDTGRINDRGDILFYGKLPGTEEDFIDGLWMKPSDGPLYLVAREGQTIDVPTNNGISPRVIESIFSASQLSDDASVAFHLRFTDNTNGLFVARQIAVPEPHGIALALLGTILTFAVFRTSCKKVSWMGSGKPSAAADQRNWVRAAITDGPPHTT